VISNSADVCFYLLTVLISISSGIDNHSASIQVGIHYGAQLVSLHYVLLVDFCHLGVHGSQFVSVLDELVSVVQAVTG